ncbi:hypothetical protein BJY59DRAFT_725509, partial [Rhodotorula toruloides]
HCDPPPHLTRRPAIACDGTGSSTSPAHSKPLERTHNDTHDARYSVSRHLWPQAHHDHARHEQARQAHRLAGSQGRCDRDRAIVGVGCDVCDGWNGRTVHVLEFGQDGRRPSTRRSSRKPIQEGRRARRNPSLEASSLSRPCSARRLRRPATALAFFALYIKPYLTRTACTHPSSHPAIRSSLR